MKKQIDWDGFLILMNRFECKKCENYTRFSDDFCNAEHCPIWAGLDPVPEPHTLEDCGNSIIANLESVVCSQATPYETPLERAPDGAGEWQTGEGPLESKYTGPKHVSLTPDSTDVYRDDIESGE